MLVFIVCRKDGKEDQLMAAQIYLKLGEVGAESGVYVERVVDNDILLRTLLDPTSHHLKVRNFTTSVHHHYSLSLSILIHVGNYSQALEDFNECLNLQLKHLPSHSRLLAETHYQLGTTYSYTAQYSQAIKHFSNSIKVIESRLGRNIFAAGFCWSSCWNICLLITLVAMNKHGTLN